MFSRSLLVLLVGFLLNLTILGGWLYVDGYYSNTTLIPKRGGEYVEGVLDEPVTLNPLISVKDTDRDITGLIFNGLTTIDSTGRMVGDLAERWNISEDNLTYTFELRQDIFWHDGEPFDADDVIFTVRLIQDETFPGSPFLANGWKGIEIERINDYALAFTLQDPFSPFMDNTLVGILPEHLLNGVTASELPDLPFNSKPVGTGPFAFSEISAQGNTVNFLRLQRNDRFFRQDSYIEFIRFRFYSSNEALVEAMRQGEVHAIRRATGSILSDIQELEEDFTIYSGNTPGYQAVFFNLQGNNPFLKEAPIRQALSLAIDRKRVIDEIVHGAARPVDGPILETSWAYTPPPENWEDFNLERARQTLADLGFADVDSDGFVERDGQTLAFTLYSDDDPDRSRLAFLLAEMWQGVGAKVDVNLFGLGTFVDTYLRPRNYDALLFGHGLTWDPDVYSHWHSTQAKDPGTNVSAYSNERLDKVLEDARRLTDRGKRQERYTEFQRVIRESYPAVFLYTPSYLYPVSKEVKDVQLGYLQRPSDRFANIHRWYIDEERVEIGD